MPPQMIVTDRPQILPIIADVLQQLRLFGIELGAVFIEAGNLRVTTGPA